MKAWHERPDEDSALLLATAYYPEFLADGPPGSAAVFSSQTALSVTLPERAGDPMELATRGHTFRVTRVSGVGGQAAGHREAASFYGKTQLLAAAGPAQRAGGRVRAQRIEEYDILEGGTAYSARYRIELPAGISGLRDTGEYLEFDDGKGGPPVLRMHYPQVRDANGTRRSGAVALRGVRDVAASKGRFVAFGVLEADLSIDLSGLRGPLVVDPGWSSTAAMATGRGTHTSTALSSGKVLVAGGTWGLKSAELFDPGSGTWTATGAMAAGRRYHTATLLPSGKVLVAGGYDGTNSLASAELYDPATGTWASTGAMAAGRHSHTATLLSSGKVLVAGGYASPSSVGSAELYDPSAGTWASTGSMADARNLHTATLLPSGKVLVVGGVGLWVISAAEVYDPGLGTWTATGSLGSARHDHTATLLPSGKVLVTGGYGGSSWLNAPEVYEPATGSWTAIAPMKAARRWHTATLLASGKVLVTGGWSGSSRTSSTELYDPGTGTWTAAPAMAAARYFHAATLLPTGQVLVSGGWTGLDSLSSAELYDPGGGAWATSATRMTAKRNSHTATLLLTGKVLVAGGLNEWGDLDSAELLDPGTGTVTAAAPMTSVRSQHTATLLASGKVLVAGGYNHFVFLASAELFDPGTGTWTATPSAMAAARHYHTATLLPSGKVLVTGGSNPSGVLNTAEVFDPATGVWTATAPMTAARQWHTATLLPSGQVLVAGGGSWSNPLTSAELFDPATGTWTATAFSMTRARQVHSATLLPSGNVLVTGGTVNAGILNWSELFEPGAGAWTTPPAAMTTGRHYHTANLLPSGRVLIAGGTDTVNSDSAGLFDPNTGAWTGIAAPMMATRTNHTATLLPSGKVLVAGGWRDGLGVLDSFELYDDAEANDSWRPNVSGPGVLASGYSARVTGTRFRGVSSASGGGTNDSPTDFPLVSLQAIDSGRLATLEVSNFTSTSADVFVPASLPLGPYILWVGANAIYGGRIVTVQADRPPVAQGQTLSTAEDTALGVALTGSDPDGDPITFAVVTPPAHGTLTGAAGSLTYTPAANFVGPDAFTFKANDGLVDSSQSTVAITVTPVNDAPVFDAPAGQSVTKDSGIHSVSVTAVGPGGGPDEAGQSVTFTATSSLPSLVPNPTVTEAGTTRTLTFSTVAGAHGLVTITLTAKDDGGTANGGVDLRSRDFQIEVQKPSHAPVAKDGSMNSNGMPIAITLQGTDEDGDPLTFTVLTQPEHGGLRGAACDFTYTPENDFSGSDRFTFSVSDGSTESVPATFSINVFRTAEPSAGCGCTSGGPDTLAAAGLFLLALIARTRPRSRQGTSPLVSQGE